MVNNNTTDECWSPFEIARKQGVHLDYFHLGSEVIGVYADLNGYQIILNTNIDNDRQEDALQLLVEHHNSKSRGIEKIVRKSDLNRVAGFHKELLRLNKVFVNALIMRRNEKA
ncbi:MAG: hypothetical protein ACE3L7_04710 [Candidatus Pristimantibacillus sp.]